MIEMMQNAPLVALGLVAVGLALGLVLGHFVLPSATRARKLARQVEALRAEQARYQHRVTEHFQTTAVLVGDLTSSYKAVYEHLATGARTLSDPALSAHGFGAPRLIVDGGVPERLPEEPLAQDRVVAPETGRGAEPSSPGAGGTTAAAPPDAGAPSGAGVVPGAPESSGPAKTPEPSPAPAPERGAAAAPAAAHGRAAGAASGAGSSAPSARD